MGVSLNYDRVLCQRRHVGYKDRQRNYRDYFVAYSGLGI